MTIPMKPPPQRQFDRVVKTREELVETGFLRDSGRRRNGQIVWVITEAGKAYAEALIAKDRPKN